MATVSTETIYCFHKEFKRVVRYKSIYKRFYITLPGEVPDHEVEANTEVDVVRAFDAAVKLYEESVTAKVKVILYGYEVDAYIKGPDDENGLCTEIFNSQDRDCTFGETFPGDGISLRLWAVVCEKSETVLKDTDNYVNYNEIESPIPDSLEPTIKSYCRHEDFTELPWTPENEQFFIDIGKAFEQLILKLNSVLGNDKAVLDFIASGQKLRLR